MIEQRVINTQIMNAKIERLESRIVSLEAVIFQAHPSEVEKVFETLEAIRIYLRQVSAADLGPGAVNFIRERLPVDWRDLVKRHGHSIVFPLLAENYSIIDARRKLK